MHKVKALLPILMLIWTQLNAQIPTINGWSQLTASADTRLIYVSDMSGNDATAQFYLPTAPQVGTNPYLPSGAIMPYKTLDAAKAQLRPGFPDWILFKRGETWTNQRFGLVTLHGRSATEPMLIGAYGDCNLRPSILTGTGTFIDFLGTSASNIAVIGIHARPHTYTGSEDPVALRLITAPFSNFLVEDCFFEFFSSHIAIHNLPSYSTSRQNLKVRRCILTDAYRIGGSGGGGFFIANVNGILFEENIIDHNGWNEDVAGADPNGFSHNTYFQVSNTNLVFQNNIVSRASATGGGFRCGGTIHNNLFLSNPKGIQFGTQETYNGSGGGLNWPSQFVSGEISDNVILDSRVESYESGTGIQVQRSKNTSVHHNIVAHFTPISTYNTGTILNEADGIDFHHNIIYNWGNNNVSGNTYGSALTCGAGMLGNSMIHDNDFQIKNLRGSCVGQNVAFAQTTYQNNHYYNVLTGGSWYEQWFQPQGGYASWLSASGETGSSNTAVSYQNPNVNISTYLNSIGGSGDLDEFLESCKQNSQCGWDDNYSAASVNNYIRDGFDLSVSLPVVLAQLEAEKDLDLVTLRWKTATTNHVKSFEIQRSTNGIQWDKIGETPIKLPENEVHQYVFQDKSPLNTAYYRLSILEIDGSTTYSNIITVDDEDQPDIQIFPNPATGTLQITFQNTSFEQVQIVNATNQVLARFETQHEYTIPIEHLPPGVYMVRGLSNNRVIQRQFLKM